MRTDFFYKKAGWILGFISAAVFIVSALFYAWGIFQVEKVAVYKRFYFLIQESAGVEASAQFIQQDGGAGYLLETEEGDCAVVAVYLKESDGQSVANKLKDKTARLVSYTTDYLYFKTAREKKNKDFIVGAFECLYDSISLLNAEIVRLDDGATQESTKRILRVLERQMTFLSKQYASLFPKYAIACGGFAKSFKDLSEEIVYARDLRYLACEFCVAYLGLAEDYSL